MAAAARIRRELAMHHWGLHQRAIVASERTRNPVSRDSVLGYFCRKKRYSGWEAKAGIFPLATLISRSNCARELLTNTRFFTAATKDEIARSRETTPV